jgi:hypothetical protein
MKTMRIKIDCLKLKMLFLSTRSKQRNRENLTPLAGCSAFSVSVPIPSIVIPSAQHSYIKRGELNSSGTTVKTNTTTHMLRNTVQRIISVAKNQRILRSYSNQPVNTIAQTYKREFEDIYAKQFAKKVDGRIVWFPGGSFTVVALLSYIIYHKINFNKNQYATDM